MGFGKKKPVRKFYLKINKQSKEEILDALKKKDHLKKRGFIPGGLIVKGKQLIPKKILEDLFDLKVTTSNIKCGVGLHDWSDESIEDQRFCKKCFEWRSTKLTK